MKIIICGNYGATNIGDDAILQGILMLIEKQSPKAEICVISHAPRQSNEKPRLPFGIRSLFNKGWIKTIREIKGCDLFILGGGGLFADTRIKAPLIWGLHALAAHLYGKPIYIFANSLGPLNTRLGRMITRKVLSISKIISFRDKGSISLARELLPDKKYKFTPDPAFAIRANFEMGNTEKKNILISIRPWTRKVNKLLKNLPPIIDTIARNNRLKIVLVPFQQKGEEDLTLMNKIIAQCKEKDMIKIYKKPDDIKDILTLFNESALVIGMRLHSLIFGTITGIPIIGINYSDKVEGYMKDMGLLDYLIEPEEISRLPELVESVLKDGDKISKYLKNKSEEQRKLLYNSSLKLSL